MMDMPISAEEMRAQAEPLIEIPGFEPGARIKVRVRRASLLRLVSEEVIPNPLLPVLYKVINTAGEWNPMRDATAEEFQTFTKVIDAVCKGILVEPAYEQVGDVLTDDQRMVLFAFAQSGVAGLAPFRAKQGSPPKARRDSKGVSGPA